MEEENTIRPIPLQPAIISPLPFNYDKDDRRVDFLIDQVSEYCGAEIAKPDTPKPYISLERLRSYLYKVTFDTIPEYEPIAAQSLGGCTSFVKDGKLYRNLDWNYDETASFVVSCKGFIGMSFINGLEDGNLDDRLIGQLPYHMTDGVNENGIIVSTHVLFNDWGWHGSGDKNVSLTKVPYIVLSTLTSLNNIEEDLADTLNNVYDPAGMTAMEYLVQYVVTDGTKTYVLTPPEASEGAYMVVDITDNPKLTNFRWVEEISVERANLQTRPTGVERWNMISGVITLEDLKFTIAYETPNRLSEFIGLRDTTKDSTDEELTEVYESAREKYVSRIRNGETWQTMHSVVYSPAGMEVLHVQEDFNRNYALSLNSTDNELINVNAEEESERLNDRKSYWARLWQVIRFISNITCWTDQAEDTFMMQTRKQTYSIDQICACRPGCCHCNEDEIAIPLEYAPTAEFGPFVSGEIIVFVNGEPVKEVISAKYLNDHYDESSHKVHIIREDFPKTLLYREKCCCLCRRKANITLRYNAGYNGIPAGLLPMICPLITKMNESKNGLSDCANTMTQVSGLLKSKKVGNIQYQWSDKDSDTAKTNSLYTDLFNLATVDEVYAMSRCYIAETPEEMGDVI